MSELGANGISTEPTRRTTFLPGRTSSYARRSGVRLPVVTEGTTNAQTRRTTIVSVEDHGVVRSGLRMLLDAEAALEVVAEAGDVEAARRYVRGHKPAVLILDLNMPGEPSLPAIPNLRSEFPDTQIVVL